MSWFPLRSAATATTLPQRVLLDLALQGKIAAHDLDGETWIDLASVHAHLARVRRKPPPRRDPKFAPTPETISRLDAVLRGRR